MYAIASGRIVVMRWVDFDLEELIWDRSGKFEKNNNPIAIPLSGDVLSILSYLRERQVQRTLNGSKRRLCSASLTGGFAQGLRVF